MPSPPRVDLRHDTHSRFEPFRDQNGDLWFGRRKWDGREWKQFASGFDLPVSVYSAADGDLARLSDDGRTWSLFDANIPPRALARDAAARTAWQMTSRSGKYELRLIRYYKGGQELLRTVPCESFPGVPRFKTPDGDWWTLNYGVNGSTRKVCRLTAKGIREYPTEGYDMILSPAGNVWCRQDAKFTRYNPATDKFEPGEPWEEFAFTVGKLRLSSFANDNGGILYRRKGEAWVPLLTPFTSTQALVGRNCARGDRILMAAGEIGVLEYDARTDQWARLTDTCTRAAFDHSGRRMLFGFCMMVYDGDPLAGVTPAGSDDDDADKEFRRLLKLMDDDRWKVRDEATRKLAENMGRFTRRAVAAAGDESLSLEVRIRLQTILPQGETFPPAPPPLLRTMHPLLTPPP